MPHGKRQHSSRSCQELQAELSALIDLEDGERDRDAGDGYEISLDPLLAGAQAASVVDHRGVVPGLGKQVG